MLLSALTPTQSAGASVPYAQLYNVRKEDRVTHRRVKVFKWGCFCTYVFAYVKAILPSLLISMEGHDANMFLHRSTCMGVCFSVCVCVSVQAYVHIILPLIKMANDDRFHNETTVCFPSYMSTSQSVLVCLVIHCQLHRTHHCHTGESDISNKYCRVSGGLSSASGVTPLENFENVFILRWLDEDSGLLLPSMGIC